MAIVGGFDIHRRQVTFDYLDTVSGQVRQGRIDPACREALRSWLARFAGRQDVTFAVEGCTGWRFVIEELQRAGITALLAEPAETAHQRGPKKRAKTDKADARHLRSLVAEGRVPVSWIPPEQARELRVLLQLYRDLREEHTAWAQRIHATLFHQGVPGLAGRLSDPQVRALLEHGEDIGLSPAGAQAVAAALRRMDDLDAALAPVHAQIAAFSRRQPGCKALAAELYGVGPLVAAIVWAFLGDARRFSSSAQAVRHTGLDVTVYSSDDKRTPGAPVAPGPADLALGAVRSRPPGIARQLPRSPLLHRRRGAHRRQPRRAIGRPQARPPLPPHPAPPRRPGLRTPAGLVRQMRVNAAALTQPMHRGYPRGRRPAALLPPAPRAMARGRTASKDRRGHTSSGTTPSIIMSPGPASTVSRTEIRPGARATRISRSPSLSRRNP